MASITVFIPVYNNFTTLDKRIRSVIDQTAKIDQLIIINDCSTDESWEFLSDFIFPKNLNLTLVNITKNSGSPFGQWINGFNLASSDLIWIAEADDFCEPDYLEKLLIAFEDPRVVVSHCRSWDYRSELDKKLNQWWDSFGLNLWDNDFKAEGREIVQKFGRFKTPVINVSSAIFRKKALDGIVIPSSYKYCGDWWFWAQLFLQGKVSYISEPLNYFRIHDNSATAFNNLNLTCRAIEATEISSKINTSVNKTFEYSRQYYWLVDFWISAILGNKDFKTLKEFLIRLPKSFWRHVFRKIFSHYNKKLTS